MLLYGSLDGVQRQLALLIEEVSKEGQPQVLSDQTEAAWADVDGLGKGCGCRGPNMPYTAGLLVMIGAVLARRRQR